MNPPTEPGWPPDSASPWKNPAIAPGTRYPATARYRISSNSESRIPDIWQQLNTGYPARYVSSKIKHTGLFCVELFSDFLDKPYILFIIATGTVQCAVGWSDFQFFWNYKNCHFSMDSGWNSKTKIEKVFCC